MPWPRCGGWRHVIEELEWKMSTEHMRGGAVHKYREKITQEFEAVRAANLPGFALGANQLSIQKARRRSNIPVCGRWGRRRGPRHRCRVRVQEKSGGRCSRAYRGRRQERQWAGDNGDLRTTTGGLVVIYGQGTPHAKAGTLPRPITDQRDTSP